MNRILIFVLQVLRKIILQYIDIIVNVYIKKYISPHGSLLDRIRSYYWYNDDLYVYNKKLIYKIKMKYYAFIYKIMIKLKNTKVDCYYMVWGLNHRIKNLKGELWD